MEALPVKHKMLKGFMLQGLCNPASSEIDFIPYKHPVTGTQIGSAAFARGAAIVQISDRAYDILISSFPVAKLKYIDDDGEEVMVGTSTELAHRLSESGNGGKIPGFSFDINCDDLQLPPIIGDYSRMHTFQVQNSNTARNIWSRIQAETHDQFEAVSSRLSNEGLITLDEMSLALIKSCDDHLMTGTLSIVHYLQQLGNRAGRVPESLRHSGTGTYHGAELPTKIFVDGFGLVSMVDPCNTRLVKQQHSVTAIAQMKHAIKTLDDSIRSMEVKCIAVDARYQELESLLTGRIREGLDLRQFRIDVPRNHAHWLLNRDPFGHLQMHTVARRNVLLDLTTFVASTEEASACIEQDLHAKGIPFPTRRVSDILVGIQKFGTVEETPPVSPVDDDLPGGHTAKNSGERVHEECGDFSKKVGSPPKEMPCVPNRIDGNHRPQAFSATPQAGSSDSSISQSLLSEKKRHLKPSLSLATSFGEKRPNALSEIVHRKGVNKRTLQLPQATSGGLFETLCELYPERTLRGTSPTSPLTDGSPGKSKENRSEYPFPTLPSACPELSQNRTSRPYDANATETHLWMKAMLHARIDKLSEIVETMDDRPNSGIFAHFIGKVEALQRLLKFVKPLCDTPSEFVTTPLSESKELYDFARGNEAIRRMILEERERETLEEITALSISRSQENMRSIGPDNEADENPLTEQAFSEHPGGVDPYEGIEQLARPREPEPDPEFSRWGISHCVEALINLGYGDMDGRGMLSVHAAAANGDLNKAIDSIEDELAYYERARRNY